MAAEAELTRVCRVQRNSENCAAGGAKGGAYLLISADDSSVMGRVRFCPATAHPSTRLPSTRSPSTRSPSLLAHRYSPIATRPSREVRLSMRANLLRGKLRIEHGHAQHAICERWEPAAMSAA